MTVSFKEILAHTKDPGQSRTQAAAPLAGVCAGKSGPGTLCTANQAALHVNLLIEPQERRASVPPGWEMSAPMN
jgi:hypothetical protein